MMMTEIPHLYTWSFFYTQQFHGDNWNTTPTHTVTNPHSRHTHIHLTHIPGKQHGDYFYLFHVSATLK